MSRDLTLLEPEFQEIIVEKLLPKCKEQGYDLSPFFTQRTPWTQARLWRQSRTGIQINKAVDMLRRSKAEFLADVLITVGPQWGRWATNALPGQSWHQWGEAVDCFVLESGKAVWNSNHGGYSTYARESVTLDLEAGHYWKQRDSCHVQKRQGRVFSIYNWETIEKEMIAKFGVEESKTDVMANFT